MPTLTGRFASYSSYRKLLGDMQAFRLAFGLYPAQPLLTLRPGQTTLTLRRRTSDLKVFEKVYVRREYELPFRFQPRVIVDAGANIGLSTLFFHEVFPLARVIAVEPEPGNFELLRRNCGALTRVELVNAALWPEQTTLHLADNRVDPWAYSFAIAGNGISVRTITPKALLEMAGDEIDLMKIDIEGAEKDLFESPTPWLEHVSVLAIELHDRIRPGCTKAFYTQMLQRDFSQEVSGENLFCALRKLG